VLSDIQTEMFNSCFQTVDLEMLRFEGAPYNSGFSSKSSKPAGQISFGKDKIDSQLISGFCYQNQSAHYQADDPPVLTIETHSCRAGDRMAFSRKKGCNCNCT
jgi:hypothetical protein